MQTNNHETPMDTNTQTTITPASGIRQVRARLLDGTEAFLPIVELKLKDFNRLLEAFGDDEATIELYTGALKGTAADLDTASALEVLEVGDEVNFENFERWALRRLRLDAQLNAGSSEREQTPKVQIKQRPQPQE